MASRKESGNEFESKRGAKVQSILSQRKRRGAVEYLVRWKGFGTDEDSWEPLKNLTHCQALVDEFNKAPQATSRKGRSTSRSRSRSRGRPASKKRSSRSTSRGRKSPARKSPARKSPAKSPARSKPKEVKTEVVSQKTEITPARVTRTTETVTTSTKVATNFPHRFRPYNFHAPTWCDQCGSFIFGFYKQGLRCEESTCQMNVHHGCLENVTSNCGSSPRDTSALRERPVDEKPELRSRYSERVETIRTTTRSDADKTDTKSKTKWQVPEYLQLTTSDWPVIVIFTVVTVITLSFVVERYVSFPDLWEMVVGLVASIGAGMTALLDSGRQTAGNETR